MTLRPPLLGAIILMVAPCSSAQAEGVQVSASSGQIGRGWLFRDPTSGRCGVVTAKHVVTGSRDVVVASAVGREAMVDEVIVPDPAMDMVLLRISGPIAAHGCSSSTLGRRRLDALLAGRPRLSVEIVDETMERTWFPARLAAQDGPDRNLLMLQTGREEIKQSFSGAPVVEDPEEGVPGIQGTPVAMIINRQPDGRAAAIRFDRIRSLVEPLIRAEPALPAAAWRVVDWSGRSEPACPPSSSLRAEAECGWRVQKSNGNPIWIEFARNSPLPASGVELRSHGVSKVTVETSADQTSDVAWMKSCRIGDHGGSCAFGQTSAQRIRLSFVSQDEAEISVTLPR